MSKYPWTVAAALSLPMLAFASSHREAPNISRLPTLDGTDFYMFNSYESGRAGYVTLIANYIPLQDPYGGPNYFALDPAGLYEIEIDNNGDAKEDLTFQFQFTNTLANKNAGITLPVGPAASPATVAVPLKNVGPISASSSANLNFIETYTVTLVTGDRRSGVATPVTNAANGSATFVKPMDYIGQKSFGSDAGYAAYAAQYMYTINVPGCSSPGRVFVGQRKEGFAVNLGEVFDLVNFVPIEGDSSPGAGDGKGFPGGITQNPSHNVLANKNITSIALELPAACLKGSGNGVIGGWTTASLRQARILDPNATFSKPEVNGGAWTQVSRLGMPLVNEVVIGLPDKDHFNSSSPINDAQFATYVTNPSLPALLNALFLAPVNATLGTSIANLAPNNFPRNDLVAAFLTGFAGLNQQATVTASEMLRLNTAVAATPATAQSFFGVAGGDLAGFPNGRRPGDNVVDIALRVVMGALCYPLPIGANKAPTNLGLCTPANAPVGNVPFTDGAPVNALDFDQTFPYLKTPLPGSPIGSM
ncbi:MAG TPA: DUF4331 domain-containing protein [Steroidobacteraceae bacterium]